MCLLTSMCAFDEPVSSDWNDTPGGTASKLGPCRSPDQQVTIFLPQRCGVLAPHDGHQM